MKRKKLKGQNNLFPSAQNGKGSKTRPRDERWDKSDYWKSTEHYKRNRWAYETES